MSRQNWKAVRPLDLQSAMEWCVKFAKAKHNRSMDTIADLMGVNKWTLYKWVAEADMPLRLIHSFEHACGINYVSRYLVESRGQMVVDIPRGKKCGAGDVHALQTAYNAAVGELLKFYEELGDVDETLAAMQTALEQTSWHRGNVEKYRQPELPFDEED
ncbi:hypothetical protein [Methylomonas sp. 11b]|uniref:hypothetical protein n=1 Tax=Methylomonas sp. 11b TaxID=1168169 RepID=UPI00047C86CF|nr:hypothetical protein [Methylomonas sp. 11b]